MLNRMPNEYFDELEKMQEKNRKDEKNYLIGLLRKAEIHGYSDGQIDGAVKAIALLNIPDEKALEIIAKATGISDTNVFKEDYLKEKYGKEMIS